jgi:hypothetical protein
MNLREALIQQAPSLALQRAAADEIARLDDLVARLRGEPTQCSGCNGTGSNLTNPSSCLACNGTGESHA